MSKKSTLYIFVLFALGLPATAQTNSSSPYSAFGLGAIKGPYLPQNRAMGSIGAAIGHIGSYNNINLANPATYADIRMTTFDIGFSGNISFLSRTGQSQPGVFNGSFSHITFGVPIGKKAAVSFGVAPFSDLGYNNRETSRIDTHTVNSVYSGTGGLSKAYLGYGRMVGKHLKFGANISYLFGKLEQSATAEFPLANGTSPFRNSRVIQSNAIGGLNYDYGVHYSTELNPKTRMSLGYSGSTNNTVELTSKRLQTLYTLSDETEIVDTLTSTRVESTLKLPAFHRFGIAFERNTKWLLGADVSFGNWSNYRVAGVDPGLQNSLTFGIGGQITPDLRSVTNYLNLVDYRAGFKYEKSYVKLNNTDIKDAALTLGLGLPLPSNRGVSFYKVNFSTELGQRGTLKNGLVRERYANFFIGVTLNDLWFQKFKFD